MSGQHSLIDQKFWDAVPAATAVIGYQWFVPREILRHARETIIYIAFGALTSAGVVEVEGSHDEKYTGTWVAISTITWSAASKCHKVSITGVHKAVRLRFSTALVGGPVDGHICAD